MDGSYYCGKKKGNPGRVQMAGFRVRYLGVGRTVQVEVVRKVYGET
jgi:hypothetical protein